MDSRKYPPNWRLWHPSQGLVFQQPLYPTLDAARFFTEASVVKELETNPTGSEEEMILESEAGCGNNVAGMSSKERSLGRASTETARLASTYTSTEDTEMRDVRSGLNDTDMKGQEEPNNATAAAAAEERPSGPPFTPLDYKMPEKAFHAAIAAAENTPESFWSHTLYRGPDLEKNGKNTESKVKVHYCRTAHTAERVLEYFVDEKIIGFDLEWSPDGYKYASPRRNVSLVQIASQSRIALLHLALYPSKDELATPTLRKIMGNPDITKVGVWIKGDCNRLNKYLGVESRGIFELSHLFRQVKYSANGRVDLINKKFVSLADQVQEVLRLPLFKGQAVRASEWSQVLSMDQIYYSASDAYAAVHLFATLNHQREQLNPIPPLPFHAELNKPIPLAVAIEASSPDKTGTVELESETASEAESAHCEASSIEYLKAEEERLEAIKERIRLKLAQNIQVAEEDGEMIFSKPSTQPVVKSPAPKKSAAKALKAVESIEVEVGEEEAAQSKPSTKPTMPETSPAEASGPTLPPKDPRVVAAETWLEDYKSTLPNGKTTKGAAALRTYYIWHNNADLDLVGVGALLREPPLSPNTVAGYILQTVKHEKQPFDRVRLKTEVLDVFPRGVALKAYKGVLEMVEKADPSSEETIMIYEKEEE